MSANHLFRPSATRKGSTPSQISPVIFVGFSKRQRRTPRDAKVVLRGVGSCCGGGEGEVFYSVFVTLLSLSMPLCLPHSSRVSFDFRAKVTCTYLQVPRPPLTVDRLGRRSRGGGGESCEQVESALFDWALSRVKSFGKVSGSGLVRTKERRSVLSSLRKSSCSRPMICSISCSPASRNRL